MAADDVSKRNEDTQRKLDRTLTQGGYLVCTVAPDYFSLAERTLARSGVELVDLDSALLAQLHLVAQERNVTWDAILAADATGPDGPRWNNVKTVMSLARERVEHDLLTGPPVVVLSRCGLLGRFDQLSMLDHLREATTRSPEPGQTLRSLLVLVPAREIASTPMIGERAVPTTPGNAERLILDADWINEQSAVKP